MESKEIFTRFFKAWSVQDYQRMFDNCQKTWADSHSVEHIKQLFQDAKLKEYNIFSTAYVSGSAMKYNVDVTLADGTRFMSIVNVICEVAPHKPAPYGDWGVNPVSVNNIVSKILPKKEPKAPIKGKNVKGNAKG